MIQVEGHKHLYRDEKSGAIINRDTQGYSQYVAIRSKKQTDEEELKRLRSDIDEIKSLLYEVLNKRL
ncbi:MAG: hypothetical protein CL557_11755 [Alphaproteobacteria bacterium]|jgi:hypothetical protein|nr:hypothetical protein [Alphaproteobacteria bacterium]|tara:strand:- start:6001 stop:6201 length:201 start_codon:yes stop_codon:yes gene_type:complete